MGARIQLRRGKSAFWESENPVLHSGEPGYETDTQLLKIGDGVTPWRDLSYSSNDAALVAHIGSETPHPVYDDGPSLFLLYENAKV